MDNCVAFMFLLRVFLSHFADPHGQSTEPFKIRRYIIGFQDLFFFLNKMI